MKGGTVQIAWHGSEPVLSLDFHPPSGLLATAGADHDIKMWSLHQAAGENATPSAKFEANLSYHSAAVNAVRFSPSGEELASGADGGELLLWRPNNNDGSITWKVTKTLRFHPRDILDLEWSSDGSLLVSGSVDNSCIIWDVARGLPQQILTDHLHYVQGVAWDPAGQYLASVSGDRTCRIYSKKMQAKQNKGQDKKEFVCQYVIVKTDLPATNPVIPIDKQDNNTLPTKVTPVNYHLFHDENLPSFFRRLAWSPDGSFLLIPAGIYKSSADSSPSNTTYIVSRKELSRPVLQLPGASKPVVAVRFCPVVFNLRPSSSKSENEMHDSGIFRLPYRLVFAAATLNSVFVYDTQHACPIAVTGCKVFDCIFTRWLLHCCSF
ncbi:hypothetical protein O6H91_06G113500 [Diphasiastrum complanatum]|uniref:Uncharacterized protein n=1 Tax=Diphasiastrum complanatum TaxID=34168 RepID=A0ACC2DHN5_DIPCM|nr:hypothetical protein O6H91_06G113500 [Diphasiastrum complanatum]